MNLLAMYRLLALGVLDLHTSHFITCTVLREGVEMGLLIGRRVAIGRKTPWSLFARTSHALLSPRLARFRFHSMRFHSSLSQCLTAMRRILRPSSTVHASCAVARVTTLRTPPWSEDVVRSTPFESPLVSIRQTWSFSLSIRPTSFYGSGLCGDRTRIEVLHDDDDDACALVLRRLCKRRVRRAGSAWACTRKAWEHDGVRSAPTRGFLSQTERRLRHQDTVGWCDHPRRTARHGRARLDGIECVDAARKRERGKTGEGRRNADWKKYDANAHVKLHTSTPTRHTSSKSISPGKRSCKYTCVIS